MSTELPEMGDRVNVFDSSGAWLGAGEVCGISNDVDGITFFDVQTDHGALWEGICEIEAGLV